MCFNGGNLLNCFFSDEGILNVRFSNAIAIGTGKKLQILVTGIVNPVIDSDLIFPCTVNDVPISTGVRRNLITGSGKLAGGVIVPSGNESGKLR